jgi:hypothetical protein
LRFVPQSGRFVLERLKPALDECSNEVDLSGSSGAYSNDDTESIAGAALVTRFVDANQRIDRDTIVFGVGE